MLLWPQKQKQQDLTTKLKKRAKPSQSGAILSRNRTTQVFVMRS